MSTPIADVWWSHLAHSAPKLEIAQFKDGIAALVDDFYKGTFELLEGEWLKLDGLDATVDAAGVSLSLSCCPRASPS